MHRYKMLWFSILIPITTTNYLRQHLQVKYKCSNKAIGLMSYWGAGKFQKILWYNSSTIGYQPIAIPTPSTKIDVKIKFTISRVFGEDNDPSSQPSVKNSRSSTNIWYIKTWSQYNYTSGHSHYKTMENRYPPTGLHQ